MPTQSRAAPHLLLGTLTVLAVAAILFSLATAPPNAEQQLRQAARNTVGADSFVLTDTITVRTLGAAPSGTVRHEEADVVYRAPDRVRETVTVNGRSLSVLAIGNERWERSGTGPWLALGSQVGGGVPAGQAAADGVLQPLKALTTATDVTRSGDRFTFVPGDLSSLLTELLGSAATQLPAKSTTFEATVAGDSLREFRIDARPTGGEVVIDLVLGSYGAAPALEPPSVASAPGR